MTIDILSDLHLDLYLQNDPSVEDVTSIFTPIFTAHNSRSPGDILIVAGDIGHSNLLGIRTLKIIKEVFEYKYIICVLGNHDYYVQEGDISLDRTKEMRGMINELDGMYCLDGEIVQIDGIKFGGCDSWYDGEYVQKHFHSYVIEKDEEYLNILWNMSVSDSKYVKGLYWVEHSKKEKEKIEKIYKDVDVMITHVNPSILKKHIDKKYREFESTGFFCFDGLKYLKEGNMKYWIYGHTHKEAEHEIHGVQCICSPMGYPSENDNCKSIRIKSIEI